MNDYLYLFVGLLVGLLLSGLVWWFWGRFRASTGYSASLDEDQDDEELKSRLDELTILHAIATAGAEASDEDNLIESVTRVIGENLYPNNFGVLLREENGDRLRTHPSYREEGKLRGPEWVPIGEGICGQVALLGESRYVPDVTLSLIHI